MKTKLLILLLFCWFQSPANLPTTNICWSDIKTSVYFGCPSCIGVNCLSDAFTQATPSYFDPAYAIAGGNWLSEFRNYGPQGCTRPSGLTGYIFYWFVDGVRIENAAAAIYYRDNFSCTGTCWSTNGETLGGEGNDVYYIWGATDCTKVADYYYVMTTPDGSSKWAVYISGGVLHYVPE